MFNYVLFKALYKPMNVWYLNLLVCLFTATDPWFDRNRAVHPRHSCFGNFGQWSRNVSTSIKWGVLLNKSCTEIFPLLTPLNHSENLLWVTFSFDVHIKILKTELKNCILYQRKADLHVYSCVRYLGRSWSLSGFFQICTSINHSCLGNHYWECCYSWGK